MPEESPGQEPEFRFYVPDADSWQAHIKRTWEREYCYQKLPGDDFFHLLQKGEVYLQCDTEKLCLNCARRRGVLTTNRLYWQRGSEG